MTYPPKMAFRVDDVPFPKVGYVSFFWRVVVSVFIFQDDIPRCSTYGIFTYVYHKFKPNVGKYTTHGAYGILYR